MTDHENIIGDFLCILRNDLWFMFYSAANYCLISFCIVYWIYSPTFESKWLMVLTQTLTVHVWIAQPTCKKGKILLIKFFCKYIWIVEWLKRFDKQNFFIFDQLIGNQIHCASWREAYERNVFDPIILF